MSERLWTWHVLDSYWSTSTPSFTGIVFRGVPRWETGPDGERRRVMYPAPGMQAPNAATYGNGQPIRYAVAIVGAAWSGSSDLREVYVLRGSLTSVRAKLVAALERRQSAYDRRPIAHTADQLDWRRDGPWFSPFHRVTDE
jgi:hypothetical protein